MNGNGASNVNVYANDASYTSSPMTYLWVNANARERVYISQGMSTSSLEYAVIDGGNSSSVSIDCNAESNYDCFGSNWNGALYVYCPRNTDKQDPNCQIYCAMDTYCRYAYVFTTNGYPGKPHMFIYVYAIIWMYTSVYAADFKISCGTNAFCGEVSVYCDDGSSNYCLMQRDVAHNWDCYDTGYGDCTRTIEPTPSPTRNPTMPT